MIHFKGARINEKYHDTSVLLTEQINVQLRIFENCCRSKCFGSA